jgi:hypothetical protein
MSFFNKYVLIGFYNRYADTYDVYGYINGTVNVLLKSQVTHKEAIEEAFKYGVPIIEGQGENISYIAEILDGNRF